MKLTQLMSQESQKKTKELMNFQSQKAMEMSKMAQSQVNSDMSKSIKLSREQGKIHITNQTTRTC